MGADERGGIDSRAIVEEFMQIYAERRIDDAVAYLDADSAFVLNIDEATLPYAGENRGKVAIRAVLHQLDRDFEYILYKTTTMSVAGPVVRQRLEFILRHRASNERLSGIGRFVWTVADDGRILRCEEYHDRSMLESFFRLFGGSSATTRPMGEVAADPATRAEPLSPSAPVSASGPLSPSGPVSASGRVGD